MTLSDPEVNGVIAFSLRYFTEYGIASGAHYVKMVEDVAVIKLTFANSSPDDFLVYIVCCKVLFVLVTSVKHTVSQKRPTFDLL